jgi:hypothetical protein
MTPRCCNAWINHHRDQNIILYHHLLLLRTALLCIRSSSQLIDRYFPSSHTCWNLGLRSQLGYHPPQLLRPHTRLTTSCCQLELRGTKSALDPADRIAARPGMPPRVLHVQGQTGKLVSLQIYIG